MSLFDKLFGRKRRADATTAEARDVPLQAAVTRAPVAASDLGAMPAIAKAPPSRAKTQTTPTHFLTEDDDAPRAETGKPMLTILPLASAAIPTHAALVAAIKKRIPDFEAMPEDKDAIPDAVSVLGIADGSILCGISVIAAANPMSESDSCVRNAWWWSDAWATLRKRKGHALVSLLGAPDDAKQRAILQAKLAVAACDCLPVLAVIWDDADAVWPRDWFLSAAARADQVPLMAVVSVKIGEDKDHARADASNSWLAMTNGLPAFGLKEIEYRGFEGEPMHLFAILMNIAAYLIEHGPVLEDGDTVGGEKPGAMPLLRIQSEPSSLVQDLRVYRAHRIIRH